MNFRFTKSTLLVFAFLGMATNLFAEHKKIKKGATITYRGNVFVLDKITPESVGAENAASMISLGIDSIPVTMNGKTLLKDEDVSSSPSGEETIEGIIKKVVKQNKNQFLKLGEGAYTISVSQVVIGQYDNVVYYHFEGVEPVSKNKSARSSEVKKAYTETKKLIDDYLESENVIFNAASIGKDRVVCLSLKMNALVKITISKGQINFQ